jgi:hypothetical protein
MHIQKWIIVYFLFLSSYFLSFSEGTVEPVWPIPGEMKLTIINQTNNEIKIYMNRLDRSVTVMENDKYYSDILLMDFDNSYPLFIGIEYHDEQKDYYIFRRAERREINSFNYNFYLIINNNGVYIFDENSYLDDRSIERKQRSFDWIYYGRHPHNCLEILIINDTTMKMNIIFSDSIEEQSYELDIGEARLLKILDPIFLQGNKYENLEYNFYSIETDNLDYPAINGVFRRPIRLEGKLQLFRLVETTNGKITIWTF